MAEVVKHRGLEKKWNQRYRRKKAASPRLPRSSGIGVSPLQARAVAMAILFGFRSGGEETQWGEGRSVAGSRTSPRRCAVLREQRHFLAAVMKLFSMQRTTKAC